MSAGKGKRIAPEGPLTTTSSSSDDDSPRPVHTGIDGAALPLSPPSSSSSMSRLSLSPTGDCDTTCSSPSGSSTASSRIYAPRRPGFGTHAHHESEVRRPKSKKKKNSVGCFDASVVVNKEKTSDDVQTAEGSVSTTVAGVGAVSTAASWATTTVTEKSTARHSHIVGQRSKLGRASVPMRQRALPQSFWQQPNNALNVSPGNVYRVLPPLGDLADLRPVTPPEDREDCETERLSGKTEGAVGSDRSNPLLMTAPAALGGTTTESTPAATEPPVRRFSRGSQQSSQRVITVGNTELLLLRLFDPVMQKDQKNKAIGHLRKSRTRKVVVAPASSTAGGSSSSSGVGTKAGLMLSGHQDPYLVECITDKLFPNLSLEHGRSFSTSGTGAGGGGGSYGVGGGAYGGHSTLQLLTVREGDRVVSLPSLSNDQNYGAMLSELVMHI